MEIIHITHYQQLYSLPASSVALGNFDGVHYGHQQVISKAIQIAKDKNLQAGVMTFHPHPKEVLGRYEKGSYLTPLSVKLDILEKMGLDFTIVVEFTKEFATLTPFQFIEQYIEKLNIQQVVTGFDFCFGKKGEGTTDTLQQWSASSHSFYYHMVPSIDENHEKISSSRIRKLLLAGEVKEAAHLLQRPFTIQGKVVHGEKRGRQLGFPTANIQLEEAYFLPKLGVYAVQVEHGNVTLDGVLNLGLKPTFHSDLPAPSLEVHLFDFDGNLYDEELRVHFISHIRDEQKFSSLDELKSQIQKDIFQAKEDLLHIK